MKSMTAAPTDRRDWRLRLAHSEIDDIRRRLIGNKTLSLHHSTLNALLDDADAAEHFARLVAPTEGAIPREPVLWLRMLGDTPDWGEDCCHVDADGLSLDTYNDELDPGSAEKYWALPLYRIDAAPKAPTE